MKDKVFQLLLWCSALTILLLVSGILYLLVLQSMFAFQHFGAFHFIASSDWNSGEGREQYGAFPFIAGTLLTSVLALIISIPFSIAIALFNGEFFRERKIADWLSAMVDVFSVIPSVVLGIWGYYFLRPLFIALNIGNYGCGILTAALVLALMIVPYTASLITAFISKVPKTMREGAFSLGATRLDVIRKVSIPFAGKGILAAYILSLGKVLGETMIVAMLIGNGNRVPSGITDNGNTMTSIVLNQFGTSSDLKLSSLIAIALLLFLITAAMHFVARLMMKRIDR